MKLKEFLPLTNEDIALLMLDKKGKVDLIEYSRQDVKHGRISKELLEMEVEDTVSESDMVEIWIRKDE